MFGFCGWLKSRKDHIDRNSPHYDEVQKTLSQEEQVMLQLIYTDLASRHQNNLLTFENFLLFFGLAGLWGAKLFRQFDEDCRKLISKEEFFYARTAKAPYSRKVQLLFNFFKDDKDNGIKFISFTKMLYNYSRDQLKQILMQDLSRNPEVTKKITKRSSLQLGYETPPFQLHPLMLSTKSNSEKKKESTVIEFNYQQLETEKEKQDITSYDKHYAEFSSEYKDPGTILQLKLNSFTYKVNYCNMITLVKEFTKNLYKSYNIDIKHGILTFEQFDKWIRAHPKLFQTYYTSFHVNLWSYYEGEPSFISKIQRTFQAKLHQSEKTQNVYGMMVGDILILAESYKHRKTPIKVVCLEGLLLNQVRNQHGYGIQFYHREGHYSIFVLYFQKKVDQEANLASFQLFQGDNLYELYDVHEMIGTGKFSIVYRCTEKATGKSYALKDISTEKLDAQAIATIDNESEIMKILKHPQIVNYNTTIRSKDRIYIVAQYIYGKDLYEYVRKRKRLSEFTAAFIIGKIIEAVRYLHSLDIIHRDLKPENIMVMFKKKNNNFLVASDNGDQDIENIKIIDFGLSNHQSEIEKNKQAHGLAGTPNYIAPEIILHNKASCKSDIFSIGSILYFLLSGKLAFSYKNMEYTLLRSAKGEYDFSGQAWAKVSAEAKDLVSKMLEPDPEARIALDEALNHHWFVTAKMTATAAKNEVLFHSDSEKCSKDGSNAGFGSLREHQIQILIKQTSPKERKGKIMF